ncbi:hypothetical protein HCN44_004103 [Aphidius gifuensis]|uniref:Uncharacterized protein n=1 Tax=Aphidius gifuensis TaxID=684658 RepID=A0A834XXH7_APHGI|nr:hypothetical protein HCN44_004103 [Aphidius gifuensis]
MFLAEMGSSVLAMENITVGESNENIHESYKTPSKNFLKMGWLKIKPWAGKNDSQYDKNGKEQARSK